jgi:hypothetical protein
VKFTVRPSRFSGAWLKAQRAGLQVELPALEEAPPGASRRCAWGWRARC